MPKMLVIAPPESRDLQTGIVNFAELVLTLAH